MIPLQAQTSSLISLSVWIFVGILDFGCNSTPAPTLLENFHGHVLKRRTRSVVFPNKAQLLLTPAFTKAILGGIPRGLSYSVEFDMYNPLPDTIEGWQPTILVNKIKKDKELEQLQQLKEVANNSVTDKPRMGANYSEAWTPDYESLDLSNSAQYQFPFHEDITNLWTYSPSRIDTGPNYFKRKKQSSHMRRSSHSYTPTERFHRTPFRSKTVERRNATVVSNLNSQTNNYWSSDQNYRERRDIFDQLETLGKIVNINMKSCIQRAICEMASHLKPFGDSLMDDVIRIILTIPEAPNSSNSNNYDDYSHRYADVNCAHRFAFSCPYRVMQFLTHELETINAK